MLKNYLKIAIAVLLRRKFLTFVNLFGTVLTLTVLVTAFAIADGFAHPSGAQHRYDRTLAVHNVMIWRRNGGVSGGGPGALFFTHYAKPLRTPDMVSFVTSPSRGFAYVDGRKLTMNIRFTDADYWRILDFAVRAGRVLSSDDIVSGRSVAVINEATAEQWFSGSRAIGKSIVVDNHSYEVVGVVQNEPETSRLSYADVWVPLTTRDTRFYESQWLEDNQILLYAKDAAKLPAMRDEFASRLARFEVNPDPSKYAAMSTAATTAFEDLARNASHSKMNPPAGRYIAQFIAEATIFALLFMVLPAVNMINLNVGRIMERASEIGLRKAAGASTRALVGQFIFENLMLAAVGGLLAFAAAPFVLGLVNDVVRYGQLRLNLAVFAAGLVFVIFFGVLSGIYPAWKMARLDPAAALKGQRYV